MLRTWNFASLSSLLCSFRIWYSKTHQGRFFSHVVNFGSCDQLSQKACFVSNAAKTCSDPGTPSNGKKDGYEYTFRKRVYYSCDTGYKLAGSQYRQCQANQQWSGSLPTCQGITYRYVQTLPLESNSVHLRIYVASPWMFGSPEEGKIGIWVGRLTKPDLIQDTKM